MEKSKLPTKWLIHKSFALQFMFFSIAYGIIGPGKTIYFNFFKKVFNTSYSYAK
jgi:hypothetical protein